MKKSVISSMIVLFLGVSSIGFAQQRDSSGTRQKDSSVTSHQAKADSSGSYNNNTGDNNMRDSSMTGNTNNDSRNSGNYNNRNNNYGNSNSTGNNRNNQSGNYHNQRSNNAYGNNTSGQGNDQVYRNATGPNGEKLYTETRYYWLDKNGKKHYVSQSNLRSSGNRNSNNTENRKDQ